MISGSGWRRVAVSFFWGILFLVWGASVARAQDPLSFADFAKVIDPYFAPELVQDIKEVLPQTNFDIWGYDVGDYTGDSANDVVLTLRQKNDSRKRVNVYFFIDDEGTLRLVKQTTMDFVDLPIEAGVAIKDGNAYMVHKTKEFEWESFGYRFRNGVLMMVDKFSTERANGYIHEASRNFQTLEGFERFLNISNEQPVFRSDFLTIPSYQRGRDVATGYQNTAQVNQARYVTRGNGYWTGPKDASFEVRSAFDNEFLYLTINVTDDVVIPAGANLADSLSDRLEVWMDMYQLGDRFHQHKRSRELRMVTDTNIYAFTVTLGDLGEQQGRVKSFTSNALDPAQLAAAKRIKAVVAKLDSGYVVKLRIPFSLLGFEKPPIEPNSLTEFGLTVLLHDVDNSFRPEEETTIATAQLFDATKPATFGSLVLVPETQHYGESVNIYLGDLKERLKEVGY